MSKENDYPRISLLLIGPAISFTVFILYINIIGFTGFGRIFGWVMFLILASMCGGLFSLELEARRGKSKINDAVLICSFILMASFFITLPGIIIYEQLNEGKEIPLPWVLLFFCIGLLIASGTYITAFISRKREDTKK